MFCFKKLVMCFLIGAAIIFTAAPPHRAFAQENYSVAVNGVPLKWDNAAPSMEEGRLTIPLNSFCAALGAETKWDGDKQEVFLFWQGRYAWMQISNPTLYYGPYVQGSGHQESGYQLVSSTLTGSTQVQGNSHRLTDVFPMELPVQPEMRQGRIMVPLAPLAEAFGGSIAWNPDTQTADVAIPVPQNDEVNASPDVVSSEGEPAAETEPGYFQLISLDEAISRYENDDPFVLVQYDSGLPSEALYEMMKAAADMQIKILGLDITKETAVRELEFGADGGYEVNVYLINGYGRVAAMGDPGYRRAVDALKNYMETE